MILTTLAAMLLSPTVAPEAPAQSEKPWFVREGPPPKRRPIARGGAVLPSPEGCYAELGAREGDLKILVRRDDGPSAISFSSKSESINSGDVVALMVIFKDVDMHTQVYKDVPFTVTVDEDGVRFLTSGPMSPRVVHKLQGSTDLEFRYQGKPAFNFSIEDSRSMAASLWYCMEQAELNPADPFSK